MSVAVAQSQIAVVPTTAEGGEALPALIELKVVRSSRSHTPDVITVETAEIPEERPRILDKQDAERLLRNEGITLQWIGWEERGPAWVAVAETGHWLLTAEQRDEAAGRLDLEGFITEIGPDYFDFKGTIKMLGTPDKDRLCNSTKEWRFEVTQNRSYYRLREFEWCDHLTDYIDIYFPPDLR
ncbi:MAG: hypothetical protein AAGI28_08925 [Pseudomonadota bacterium]